MDDIDASTMMVMMTPYLHFTGGDILYFKDLQPTSNGAIAGACIVLFVLSVVHRALNAGRGVLESRWRQSVLAAVPFSKAPSRRWSIDRKQAGSAQSSPIEPTQALVDLRSDYRARLVAPFIPSHDLSRGALFAFQSLFTYLLMLAVMTFQAAYIISIVLGFGVGEMAFGRYA